MDARRTNAKDLLALAAIAGAGLLAGCGETPATPGAEVSGPVAAPTFVGRDACADCHEAEMRLWTGSHHDLAMDEATAATVLGDFDGATMTQFGVTSTFSRPDGGYVVRTDGPDGSMQEYEVRYTFGVTPLQQYLVEFPGGRYQVLPLCWDNRPVDEGGQRWFHIYPDEPIDHEDPLHWTGPNQNWNYMCAECHSTDLRKRYRLASDAYETTWAEIDVSCEACHGPGSRHVDWAEAQETGAPAATDADLGLVVRLKDRDDAGWVFPPDAVTAERTTPRTSQVQIEMCARCHSRRSTMHDDYTYGGPLLDTHRPSLLVEPLYHADGQILDEVYVYGSFLQSRMYRQGVTCGDCHEPHTLALRAPGNGVCAKCHLAEHFDTPSHHFHAEGETGSACVDCHMPPRNYMVVDPRHDHSMRIPRPDLSLELGTPNACTGCHDDQSDQWAMDTVAEWYGPDRRDEPHFGQALAAARAEQPGADVALAAVAGDPEQPGIARATAITMLAPYPTPVALEAAATAVSDPDPLVRLAALDVLELLPPRERLRLADDLLQDPVRGVRVRAAAALAGIPEEIMSPAQRSSWRDAAQEMIAAELANAERPESHVNIGNFYAAQRRFDRAHAAYETALRLDPDGIVAHVNLADLYRQAGRDAEGEAILRDAIRRQPDAAALHHALGLLLVRDRRLEEAMSSLGRAAALEPGNARYVYVYAIGLDAAGDTAQAIAELEGAHRRHPADRDILVALVGLTRDAGRRADARRYAERLLELMPRDPEARRLLESLAPP